MVTPSVEPVASGPTYSMTNLAKNLAENKSIDFKLITFDFFGDTKNKLPYELRFKLTGRKGYGFSYDFIKFLINEFKKPSKVIIYNNSQYYLHSISIFVLRIFYKFVLVFSPRGSLDEVSLKNTGRVFIKRVLLKPYLLLLSTIDYLICTSKMEVNTVKKYFPNKEIFLLPNSTDPPKNITSSKKNIFLYLGRLIPQKGIHDLINAWDDGLASAKGWELWIAGPPSNLEYFESLKELSSNSTSIKFVGEVSGEMKWSIINMSKFLVLPSYSENFGNVVIEGMICGSVPITTSDIPWEELNEYSVGFSSERKDLPGIIKLAMEMENSKYIDLSNRTKKYAEQNYHAKKVSLRLVNYFYSLGKGNTNEQ